MILDIMVDKQFVFKNTHGENKQIKIDVDAEEAPEEFFFLHINCSHSLTTSITCASMLQTSCIFFIRQCHKKGLINDTKKETLAKYVRDEDCHDAIHKQMKTLVTKSSNVDDGDQAANLRETFSRVRSNPFLIISSFFRLRIRQRLKQRGSTPCDRLGC